MRLKVITVVLVSAFLLLGGCEKRKEEVSVVGDYFMTDLGYPEQDKQKYREEEYFLIKEDKTWIRQINICEGFGIYKGTYKLVNKDNTDMIEFTIDNYKSSLKYTEEFEDKKMYFTYTDKEITFREANFDLGDMGSVLENATNSGCASKGGITWVKDDTLKIREMIK